jgi:hypothetical protein
MCDLAHQDPAIVHNHNRTICYCCVDDQDDYDYDDGNQPPRWKDVARRSHDDGFDEYDGPDECEETDSQAADRRQEMAENAERQMEAEMAIRNPTCAGCSCDCRDNVSVGCCGHVCPSCRVSGGWVEV